MAELRVDLLPLKPAVVVNAAELGLDCPGHPADRLIVAPAIVQSATVLTKDRRVTSFTGVKTAW